jgi:hypothetical protein
MKLWVPKSEYALAVLNHLYNNRSSNRRLQIPPRHRMADAPFRGADQRAKSINNSTQRSRSGRVAKGEIIHMIMISQSNSICIIGVTRTISRCHHLAAQCHFN